MSLFGASAAIGPRLSRRKWLPFIPPPTDCLFLPEASCERGNRYLDRAVLVPTMEHAEFAFLDAGRAGMPGE